MSERLSVGSFEGLGSRRLLTLVACLSVENQSGSVILASHVEQLVFVFFVVPGKVTHLEGTVLEQGADQAIAKLVGQIGQITDLVLQVDDGAFYNVSPALSLN